MHAKFGIQRGQIWWCAKVASDKSDHWRPHGAQIGGTIGKPFGDSREIFARQLTLAINRKRLASNCGPRAVHRDRPGSHCSCCSCVTLALQHGPPALLVAWCKITKSPPIWIHICGSREPEIAALLAGKYCLNAGRELWHAQTLAFLRPCLVESKIVSQGQGMRAELFVEVPLVYFECMF